MSAMPRKRRLAVKTSSVAMGHVWTAPGWQGFSSRVQQWSEQPCVRPFVAVHMTAGHNALRGSGPGRKHAFDNALAHVGCPNRRIDRRKNGAHDRPLTGWDGTYRKPGNRYYPLKFKVHSGIPNHFKSSHGCRSLAHRRKEGQSNEDEIRR